MIDIVQPGAVAVRLADGGPVLFCAKLSG